VADYLSFGQGFGMTQGKGSVDSCPAFRGDEEKRVERVWGGKTNGDSYLALLQKKKRGEVLMLLP